MKLSLLSAVAAGVLLSGCQATMQSQSESSSAEDVVPRMHIFIESGNTEAGSQTLITQDISLLRALRHVYPDATLQPEAGVNMSQSISLWVEDASVEQFINQVGRAADASIEHSNGIVTISPVSRWNFTLPSHHREAAESLIKQHPNASVVVTESGNDFITLLVTARPSVMVHLRTAIFQLSDQATLDDSFGDITTGEGS